jgi:uncharacterized protein YjlB
MLFGKTIESKAAEAVRSPRVISFLLKDDGEIPNNPSLPVLIYRGALRLPRRKPARLVQHIVVANSWGGTWLNGIYDFHHYHSTAHEVLVVFAGSSSVKLGGEQGLIQMISRGDVLVIPAGVAHKNEGASPDFAVLGAYPEGQEWDLCYGKPGERPQTDQNIAAVPLPALDPIYGAEGPLLQRWAG